MPHLLTILSAVTTAIFLILFAYKENYQHTETELSNTDSAKSLVLEKTTPPSDH